jgi:hypothetical protein
MRQRYEFLPKCSPSLTPSAEVLGGDNGENVSRLGRGEECQTCEHNSRTPKGTVHWRHLSCPRKVRRMVLIETRSSKILCGAKGSVRRTLAAKAGGRKRSSISQRRGSRAKTRVSWSDNLVRSGTGKSAPWLVL